MRTGIIAKKIGMTRLYLADGTHVPVTVLSIEDSQVIGNQTKDKNGYNSITLGAGEAKQKNTNKAQKELYARIKVTPKKKQMEFRVSESNMVPIGAELSVNHFVVGQYVDATGITIGKGFAGAMKRHNFSGLRASHGVSISHRSHGSTGNSQDPGRVFKGKKMAGHMGDRQRTIQNLQVVAADDDRGLIFIKGGLPGSKGSWMSLKDAIKKAVPSDVPYPAGIKDTSVKPDKEDIKAEKMPIGEDIPIEKAAIMEAEVSNNEEAEAKEASKVEVVANVKVEKPSEGNKTDDNNEKEN